MQHYGDNFIPVVPSDTPVHTAENPFCGDTTCPCYEDPDNIEALNQAIQEGVITPEEATDIIKGRAVA